MSLIDTLFKDLKKAMKSGDKLRTETLRYSISAIKKYEIDNYPPGAESKLTDGDVVNILKKQIKERREAIVQFEKGERQDLVEKEKAEIEIIRPYLPPEMSDAEIKDMVEKVIQSGTTQFGQVMGKVMTHVKGRVDGSRVADIVKSRLL